MTIISWPLALIGIVLVIGGLLMARYLDKVTRFFHSVGSIMMTRRAAGQIYNRSNFAFTAGLFVVVGIASFISSFFLGIAVGE